MTPAEEQLESLARDHGPRVLAYLARRVTPREDAADLWQQVLTTTWRKLHTVPSSDEAALCWLLAVARRELANHRRGHQRRLAATDRLRETIAVGGRTAYEGALAADADPAADRLGAALARLDDADREVLTLCYWDGLTGDQIGAVIGVSAASARKRLQRARDRLAVILATTGKTAGHEHASVITGGRA